MCLPVTIQRSQTTVASEKGFLGNLCYISENISEIEIKLSFLQCIPYKRWHSKCWVLYPIVYSEHAKLVHRQDKICPYEDTVPHINLLRCQDKGKEPHLGSSEQNLKLRSHSMVFALPLQQCFSSCRSKTFEVKYQIFTIQFITVAKLWTCMQFYNYKVTKK